MQNAALAVVTGAFGFTGAAITRLLLNRGVHVRTLTGHPERPHPFGQQVRAFPLAFDRPDLLVEALRGAEVLYNTYWVRFERGPLTFERAVQNSLTLLRAAQEAGVRRIVHIGIANASEDSPLPYYRGKARVEQAIMRSGLSYAIVRPTVLFGVGAILINNIAWLLRRFPVFVVPGDGKYGVQPVSVEDVAELAVGAGQSDEDIVMDAAGPETYSYEGLVQLLARAVGRRVRLVHASPGLALLLARAVGYAVGDVLITREEIEGLMAGLLVSHGPPTGQRRLSAWLEEHGPGLGLRYLSELEQHYT